jgi:ABC-type transport system involved in multi-copper enzyme maturation permease subunit
MSLTLLLSTRLAPMTGGVIALVLFFVAWIGGIALAVGQAFNNDTIVNIGIGSRLLIPTDGLWHGAIFNLEPTQILNLAKAAGRARAGNPFLAEDPLPIPYLLWCVGWVLAVLGLANWSFQRRDL